MVCGAMLLVIAAYYWTAISRITLFRSACIATRPPDALIGNFLDKLINVGSLALSRYTAAAVLFAFILTIILLFRQREAARVL